MAKKKAKLKLYAAFIENSFKFVIAATSRKDAVDGLISLHQINPYHVERIKPKTRGIVTRRKFEPETLTQK